jgi:hypothetical protein
MKSSHTQAPIDKLLLLIPEDLHRTALELINQIALAEYRDICQKKLFIDMNYNKNIEETFGLICDCIRSEYMTGDFEKSPKRDRNLVFPRQLAAYFTLLEFRNVPGAGLARIGRLYTPKKHHATIVHSRQVVENLFLWDTEVEKKVTNVAECLDRIGISQPINTIKQLKNIKDGKKKKTKV